jgi:hypothetical protein
MRPEATLIIAPDLLREQWVTVGKPAVVVLDAPAAVDPAARGTAVIIDAACTVCHVDPAQSGSATLRDLLTQVPEPDSYILAGQGRINAPLRGGPGQHRHLECTVPGYPISGGLSALNDFPSAALHSAVVRESSTAFQPSSGPCIAAAPSTAEAASVRFRLAAICWDMNLRSAASASRTASMTGSFRARAAEMAACTLRQAWRKKAALLSAFVRTAHRDAGPVPSSTAGGHESISAATARSAT